MYEKIYYHDLNGNKWDATSDSYFVEIPTVGTNLISYEIDGNEVSKDIYDEAFLKLGLTKFSGF